jgi:hypothetical protein
MQAKNSADDATLLLKINEAVAAANEAEKTVETAQAELVSRSKAVGTLLLEAKKLHPAVKDFEAFLKRVDGLKLSRAYDLMRLAGGRITDEQLKEDARLRKQKSRASKKLPKPAPALKKPEPEPKPEPVSVTDPSVTESVEASAERRKAEKSAKEKAAEVSANALAEFKFACETWLPRITVKADRHRARMLFMEIMVNDEPKAEAA